jgi:hypothetical protein
LKGDPALKKVGLGIALLLFAILLKLCSSGMDSFALFLGLTGLIISFLGSIGKTE